MSIEEAYRLYQPLIAKYARVLCKNREDGEDVASRTWIKALRNWHKLEDGANPLPWLRQICARTYIEHYRERRRRLDLLSMDALFQHEDFMTVDPVNMHERTETAVDLERFMETITPGKADIIRLRLDGYSIPEIGRKLNRPVRGIAAHLNRIPRSKHREATLDAN